MQKQIVYVLMGKRNDPTYYDFWVQDVFHEEVKAQAEADRLNNTYLLSYYYVDAWIVS
jgi:hypothetical protein